MSILRRRIRGILGMSLVWGVGFALFGALLALIVSILDPSSMDTGETIPGIAGLMSTVGAVGGALFGVLFSVSHRRSTFKALSLGRLSLAALSDSG
jgi:membrane associated rhomboid family serine protease